MSAKETLIAVFNYLSDDVSLLTLMGLDPNSNSQLYNRIVKTKQLSNVADRNARLAIYEKRPERHNQLVHGHTLVVDILVPLEIQQRTGLACDMANRVKIAVDRKSISYGANCRKLIWHITLEDQPTSYGWYKTSVVFTYNKVEK